METAKINLLSTMMRLKLFGNLTAWPAFGPGGVVHYCADGWLVRCLKDKPDGRLVVTRIY